LSPEQVTRLDDAGREERTDAATVAVGDVLLVRPGELIGADAVVIDGLSEVNQASITGEPLPVLKRAGTEVFAGTVNGAGALRVRVHRPAAESVVARIAAQVEETSATKAKTQLIFERIEQRYCVGVAAATIALFALPMLLGESFVPTLLRAMTFMIVASPCAVLLSTMPPLLSAIANAGRHGVLVKSAVVVERLSRVDCVAFDKTGTLTYGTPRLTTVHVVPDVGLDANGLLALAAAVERFSEHHLAKAIVSAAEEAGAPVASAYRFISEPGCGVTATVGGRAVQVGSPTFTTAHPPADGRIRAQGYVDQIENDGGTAVVVVVDGGLVGVLGLTDRVRPDAPAAVAALKAGTAHPPVLLTGDNARAAAHVAGEVGIDDINAALLPAEKATHVQDLQTAGRHLLFVGDGVNDAPALATAHLGVALAGHGSNVTLQTADAVIVRDDLSALAAALELSRRACRAANANLLIAATAIIGLSGWDLIGHLPLVVGVAGHEGSTAIIGLNGLRLLRNSAWQTHYHAGNNQNNQDRRGSQQV
jgi:heavy metal translocating P-type ATPase